VIGVLDDLAEFAMEIPELLSPEVIGATIGATFGPVGILIGTMIGAVVDNALGAIIDDIFGCDCSVAGDTVVLLPGDHSLLPIPLTTAYHRSGGGVFCQKSSYTITSTLYINQTDHHDMAASLQSPTNWTISLLDLNAPLDWSLLNVGDTLYSGGDTPQTWAPAGIRAEFWGTPWWATINSLDLVAISSGQRIAFGTYFDGSGGFKFGILSQALSPDVVDPDCIASRHCPAKVTILVAAEALPSDLQNNVFLSTPCGHSQLLLSGFWNRTYQPTAETYIVNYATNKTVKIPDAPFPVDKWGGDGLVYTGSWAE
jgi:hypothetical protein